jgi:hypothetical protein
LIAEALSYRVLIPVEVFVCDCIVVLYRIGRLAVNRMQSMETEAINMIFGYRRKRKIRKLETNKGETQEEREVNDYLFH